MEEVRHLSQELPIKRRDWKVKRRVTLNSKGQVGGRVNNIAGLKEAQC